MGRACIAILLVIVAVSPAYAWNSTGHSAIALLAFRKLDAGKRAAVLSVLRNHPHYSFYFDATRPPGVDEAEWAVFRAATWPDSVRIPHDFHGDPATHPIYKFHRSAWHFVNYPYKQGACIAALPTDHLPAATTVLEQIPASVTALAGTAAGDSDAVAGISDDANKAVRLCWLLHLVGDIHQPLHVTALVKEPLFPADHHGDQGGNSLAVQLGPHDHPVKLHSYWDSLLGSDSGYAAVKLVADDLETSRGGLTQPEFDALAAKTDLKVWALESYQAAASAAYLDGALPLVVFHEGMHSGHGVPVLTAQVQDKAGQVARQRAAVGGRRLAAMMNAALP
jgi:hypothetical protein